tara:strand:+ start:145 stop:483 length:339 start_codon:yes stop_codon:yes gene_type:complete
MSLWSATIKTAGGRLERVEFDCPSSWREDANAQALSMYGATEVMHLMPVSQSPQQDYDDTPGTSDYIHGAWSPVAVVYGVGIWAVILAFFYSPLITTGVAGVGLFSWWWSTD